MSRPTPTPNPPLPPGHLASGKAAIISAQLLAVARADDATVLQELGTRLEGLSQAEAEARLKQVGPTKSPAKSANLP